MAPPNGRVPKGGWKEGHIAFLRTSDSYSNEDYDSLIRSGYIAEMATCHPVIVLGVTRGHMMITPVSAYHAEFRGMKAPWKQSWHLKEQSFRAFDGSEQPRTGYPALQLHPGMAMPKPKESWVNVQSVWVVPRTVIGKFTKVPDFLRMTKESFDSLRRHMELDGPAYRKAKLRLNPPSPPAAPIPAVEAVKPVSGTPTGTPSLPPTPSPASSRASSPVSSISTGSAPSTAASTPPTSPTPATVKPAGTYAAVAATKPSVKTWAAVLAGKPSRRV
ncbi:hypothetical protein QBC39DRAFT_252799 [Podospora conica]|nr:hypothetical protein QBC39DRAFT_252799 [Schizothecium conicum]